MEIINRCNSTHIMTSGRMNFHESFFLELVNWMEKMFLSWFRVSWQFYHFTLCHVMIRDLLGCPKNWQCTMENTLNIKKRNTQQKTCCFFHKILICFFIFVFFLFLWSDGQLSLCLWKKIGRTLSTWCWLWVGLDLRSDSYEWSQCV